MLIKEFTTFYNSGGDVILNLVFDKKYRVDLENLLNDINEKMRKEKEIEFLLSEKKKKRSLDSNAYYWELAHKLSPKIRVPAEEIYRQHIKNIGDNSEIVPIKEIAVEAWKRNWASKGTGWICEELGSSKIDGYINVICYYGSSVYDSKQMSDLIGLMVEDCKEQGIETATPEELQRLNDDWRAKHEA